MNEAEIWRAIDESVAQALEARGAGNPWRRWAEQARPSDDNPFQVLLDYERYECSNLVGFNTCHVFQEGGCPCLRRTLAEFDVREV